MKTIFNFLRILLISTILFSCKKESVEPEVSLKGKIAPSLSMEKDGEIEFFDLRDVNNPKKAAFNIIGTADNFYLQYVKSRPIGNKTIMANYGNLSINHNKEMYLADKNWPGWKNISTVGDWLIMNNDNTNQLYPAYQDYDDSTELYSYTSFFEDFATKPNWGNAGIINGCAEVYENYNSILSTRNAFYFNFKTQEYLFDYNINNSEGIYTGYKITDLIKKPNGNMDTDPIDWTKADFVFTLSYNHSMETLTYNGKNVTALVFVDMDSQTYAYFLRNAEDDLVNGADKGRQTLMTTTWQPLSNLFKGWDL